MALSWPFEYWGPSLGAHLQSVANNRTLSKLSKLYMLIKYFKTKTLFPSCYLGLLYQFSKEPPLNKPYIRTYTHLSKNACSIRFKLCSISSTVDASTKKIKWYPMSSKVFNIMILFPKTWWKFDNIVISNNFWCKKQFCILIFLS